MGEQRFEDQLLTHVDMLHNLARRLSDGREESEDLVQETVLAGWLSWQRAGAPDHLGPWLATICLNLARSRYRRRRARPNEVLVRDTGVNLAATGRPVDLEAVARVETDAVHAQLARLPAHQREAIVLMDLCGFTAAEGAQILGVARGTVLSRVHRGRQALALLLVDWLDEYQPRQETT